MNKVAKIFSYIAFVFAFCCMAIGYAAVQDELIVNGIVSVDGYVLVEIDYTNTLAYTYDAEYETLEINDTYYDVLAKKNYKVVGIKKEGFSGDKIIAAQNTGTEIPIDVTKLLHIHLSENIATIGENAFTGLKNLTSFSVAKGNAKFKVEDDVLYGVEGEELTTLVRYPSLKQDFYYIVPKSVTSITAGAFSENNKCTAIVTTQYSPLAWGSSVPNAFMLNPYGTGYDVESVVKNETGYTVTFATPPTESTFLFQGNLYPGVEPNPTSLHNAEVDGNTVQLNADLCVAQEGTKYHAQLYLSCYHTYAYGYLDGTTLGIYSGESVVIYGGVYDGKTLFRNAGIYNLPSGENSVSDAAIVPGFKDWSTVADTVEKVKVNSEIAPLKVDGWFAGMSNCKEMDLKKLNTINLSSMENLFIDCSGLDKLSLGASFGTSGQTLGYYNTGLSDVITGWTSDNTITIDGDKLYQYSGEIASDKIPMGRENSYTAVTYGYATSGYVGVSTSPSLFLYQRKYVPQVGEMFDGYTVNKVYSWISFGDETRNFRKPKPLSETKFGFESGCGTWESDTAFKRSIVQVKIVDEITPRSLRSWFYQFSQCPSFVGLENIDTSQATSMSRMFRDAVLLKDSDLKKLTIDTSATKTLYEMFYNCNLLTNADGKTFDFATPNSVISNYAGMFKDCSSLKQVDLSNFIFDTEGVTVAWMFRECNSLEEFTLPQGIITVLKDNESSVNDYYGIDCMFFECTLLEELDLSFIQVGSDIRAAATFADCINLEKIYVTENLGTLTNTLHTNQKLANDVDDTAYNKNIFTGCTILVGGSGTQFNETCIDGTYARIDGGTDNHGYFTAHTVAIWTSNEDGITHSGTCSCTAHTPVTITEQHIYVNGVCKCGKEEISAA